MSALNNLGKALKTFTPVYHNDDGTTTPVLVLATSKKPLIYWGKEKEEHAFYVFETLSSNESQIGNNSRLQILYKHKEKTLGMGMIEARNVIKDLKEFLDNNEISYNSSFLYVGFSSNEFYIYSLNFTTNENK